MLLQKSICLLLLMLLMLDASAQTYSTSSQERVIRTPICSTNSSIRETSFRVNAVDVESLDGKLVMSWS